MSTPTVRLILLATPSHWELALRDCLDAAGSACELCVVADWNAACAALAEPGQRLLLITPEALPAGERLPWPSVLLLDAEPAELPEGAIDWLIRGQLGADALRRCLRYARERYKLQHALDRLASQDPLTGIVNRQGFQALLPARLAAHDGLALGYLDLDNFRHVNDTLGHQAGDRLILQVVARLQAELQPGDLLARLGGDEFALLLHTGDAPQRVEALAERVVQSLAEPFRVDGESLLLGCSLGLAHADAQSDADELMWHAQIAMRHAKNRQGCSWWLHDPRINRSARRLADLEGELRRALRRDELELHYQPRLCLHSQRIVGLEALVRWPHAERGMLAPGDFIPMAEESGLIVPLGYWVIARALRDLRGLREQGVGELHMAINLSFRQFQDSQLLATLQRQIAECGVDPRWLEFELTETAVMRRSEQVRTTMGSLAALGVRFSLDDFGTGFSSFVHLSSLPISLLKIDKSFVRRMAAQPHHGRLVRAMVSLAHNLGLQVVAEGVEGGAQLEQLRRFAADQVQGYLISRPLPLAELQRFLGERQLLQARG